MPTVLLTSLAPLLWGTSYWVTTEFLPPNRPLFSATLRVLPGLVLVLGGRWTPSGRWWPKILVLGLLNFGVFFALLFIAAYRLPGGVGATIGGIGPLVFAFLAWPLLNLRPRPVSVLAGLAGVVGVALLVLGPGARVDGLGVSAVVAAVGCMTLGGVLSKRWVRPASMAGYVGWQMVLAGLFLGGLCLGFEGIPSTLTATNLVAFAYLGFLATGLAYALWFRGIERLGPSASFLTLLGPLVAVALGYFSLGQAVSWVQGIGILVVLSSVAAGHLASTRPESSRP